MEYLEAVKELNRKRRIMNRKIIITLMFIGIVIFFSYKMIGATKSETILSVLLHVGIIVGLWILFLILRKFNIT